MGAMASACAGDRKSEGGGTSETILEVALDFKWDNARILGIEQYEELGEVDCEARYKNKFEC